MSARFQTTPSTGVLLSSRSFRQFLQSVSWCVESVTYLPSRTASRGDEFVEQRDRTFALAALFLIIRIRLNYGYDAWLFGTRITPIEYVEGIFHFQLL